MAVRGGASMKKGYETHPPLTAIAPRPLPSPGSLTTVCTRHVSVGRTAPRGRVASETLPRSASDPADPNIARSPGVRASHSSWRATSSYKRGEPLRSGRAASSCQDAGATWCAFA